jgi:predicted 2-oxoglutarate/Fe(II)-dependent dioxygenase YbiX
VFSCSLLHRALPVTRGRRFVLTTFFRAKPS